VRINGRDYKTVAAAAKHLNCTKGAIYQAVNLGREDRVACRQTFNNGPSKPVTIGTLSFPSRASASRALGFKSGFLSKALSRGSKRGWQRILSAAMTEAARRDALIVKVRQRGGG
jgi:2-methylcitrate dehydratase PrpD